MFSKKFFILGTIFGLILLFTYFFTLPDGRLHIVFCNVGQGDAVYIRTPGGEDMLLDGGPDNRVLDCLGRYLPFYDRSIDLVMMSHPEHDHIGGLIAVVQRFKIKNMVASAVGNDSEVYRLLENEVTKKNIPVRHLYTGESFRLDNIRFQVLWPEREWLVHNSSTVQQNLSSSSNTQVLGLTTARRGLNDFSYNIHLQWGSFDALFTGDADSRVQPEMQTRLDFPDVEVLKFPHHGSKYGATDEFLAETKPELAVISVGKNPWGHPTTETLDQLANKAIKVLRTDIDGNIEVISDGKDWWVKK
jgi:competence protein ComEC